MLYTIYLLNNYSKYMSIPGFSQSPEYFNKQETLITLSNNDKCVLDLVKFFFYDYNTWLPHLIVWKNKNNYWIDENLIKYLKTTGSTKHFVYIKLSVYVIENSDTRHANVIIVDNKKKIIERFEPYGEIIYNNLHDLNNMIKINIADKLGYQFVFIQPYPGFQSRSDEYAIYNKTFGDPMGYCLAWTILYIDVKMLLFKNNFDINPIDFINWYIINQFDKDFPEIKSESETNKYMTFIRYYSKKLDSRKVDLLKDLNIEPNILYRNEIPKKVVKKLNLILNEKLYDILNIK